MSDRFPININFAARIRKMPKHRHNKPLKIRPFPRCFRQLRQAHANGGNNKKLPHCRAGVLAGLGGVEPPRRESKSRVLPLDYSPMYRQHYTTNSRHCQGVFCIRTGLLRCVLHPGKGFKTAAKKQRRSGAAAAKPDGQHRHLFRQSVRIFVINKMLAFLQESRYNRESDHRHYTK